METPVTDSASTSSPHLPQLGETEPQVISQGVDSNEPDTVSTTGRVAPEDERVKSDGSLVRHSRRTERLMKKQLKRKSKPQPEFRNILDVPYEILMEILSLVLPTDLVRLSRTSKAFRDFIGQEEHTLARTIISWRYLCLEKCFRLPVALEDVDPSFHPALLDPGRLGFLKKPFQHVALPDPNIICTCLTCQLRWNSLCIVLDFAYWRDWLNSGDPLPMIPRGKNPVWNQKLNNTHAQLVVRAMQEPIWYACILQTHLQSTVDAIKRNSANKGNRRKRFRMTETDERAGTDLFLERSGPPTVDFPFHRDNYYLLEAYLPNRGWNKDEDRWMYMSASQHDVDVTRLAEWYERQKAQKEQAASQIASQVSQQAVKK